MKNRKFNLIELEEVDSTNNYAKALLQAGCREETVVCARVQSAGRGRFERSFVSSEDFGLWFTVIFFPDVSLKHLGLLGCAAAVATSHSIERLTGIRASIKWPNDVEVEGKKVCGILAESALKSDKISWAIVGIGVNVNLPPGGFAEGLKEKATSLSQHFVGDISRSELLDLIVTEFFNLCEALSKGDASNIIQGQREYSSILGEQVSLYLPQEMECFAQGKVVDFGEYGELVLLSDQGELRNINYGEVSLRKNKNRDHIK